MVQGDCLQPSGRLSADPREPWRAAIRAPGDGQFLPSRLPESMLQEVWTYIVDLGFRARMHGQLSAGAVEGWRGLQAGCGKYRSRGQRADGRGRDRDAHRAERGERGCSDRRRYQGVRRDEQAKANVAVWTVSRMAPKDRQTYTLTLSQAGTAKDNVRGTIRWTKPTVKTGANDAEAIAPAPLGAQSQ